jgi:aspartyl protease family protein
MDSDTTARLIYLSVLVAAVGGWALVEMRGKLSQSLRYFLVWGFIAFGLIASYGLWSDIKRGLIGGQSMAEGGTITLPRAPDGHFYADLLIEGQSINFLIDTGATTMVLTKSDVARIGIDPAALVYSGQALTANGAVRTATVRLSEVELGPHRDLDFAAEVNDGDLDISLLGMTYLSRYRISVAGDQMELSR